MKAGWKVRPLGEVCSFENGDRGKNYPGKKCFVASGVPFINAGLVDDGQILWDAMNFIPEDRFDLLSRGKIQTGDFLFCLRGSLGKFGQYVSDRPAAIASSLVIIRPSDEVLASFFAYYLRTAHCAAEIERLAAGAAQPNLGANDLKQFSIPIPPLEEQKRIVAVLDAAFEGLTRAKENAEANLQNARELFESGFEAQLENSKVETETFRFGDENILQIIDGDRGKAYPKKSDFLPSGFCLFLSTKNVRSNGFKFDDCQFITKAKDVELRKGKLQRRDVVLTTRGTIGNIGLFDDLVAFDQIRINSGMLILRPNEEVLLADYLFEALRSRIVRSQIEEETSGAAQPQLPIRTLRELKLTIPTSTKEQAKLVAGLQEHQDGCRELEDQYRLKLTDIADLRQSLLQKAFAGGLT